MYIYIYIYIYVYIYIYMYIIYIYIYMYNIYIYVYNIYICICIYIYVYIYIYIYIYRYTHTIYMGLWLPFWSLPGPRILGDLRTPGADQGGRIAEGLRQRRAGGGRNGATTTGVGSMGCITPRVTNSDGDLRWFNGDFMGFYGIKNPLVMTFTLCYWKWP